MSRSAFTPDQGAERREKKHDAHLFTRRIPVG